MTRRSLRVVYALGVITTCLTLAPKAQVQSQSPVAIDTGQITGALTGPNHDISVYKGIPYVTAPVGDRRWREPQPVAKWAGVREATSFSPIPRNVRVPSNKAKTVCT